MNIMFVFNLQNKVISYKYLNILYWMLMPSFILTLNDCWNDASVSENTRLERVFPQSYTSI